MYNEREVSFLEFYLKPVAEIRCKRCKEEPSYRTFYVRGDGDAMMVCYNEDTNQTHVCQVN